ncbi:MAG TPA: hypothetical protein VFB04_07395 [Terriglobales bacterium]|nr:hypothetical protein [Terriglobales bacterium]
MAELKRKEEQLTTADLAGRNEPARTEHDLHPVETPDKPKPVRSETMTPKPRETPIAAERSHAPETRSQEPVTPLFSDSDVGDLRSRWSNVQTGFVDEPRRAVEEADKLVAAVMQRLAEGFANERATLEKAWDRGDNISTEDLRVALRRYRSFFDRLLNA